MKIKTTWIILVALGVCLMTLSHHAAESPADQEKGGGSPKIFEAKVVKVFEAKDGTAIFRAYVVKWKNQEVIVSDPLAITDHKKGDTITVISMNLLYPGGLEPHRILGFSISPAWQ